MILPVYKPIGASTHQLAKRAGNLFKQKASHTGTLDPIADGVVVVTLGEDRLYKEKIGSVLKRYSCQVLFGFKTDSHDVLGIIESTQATIAKSDIANWQSYCTQFIGQIPQVVPSFSARRYQGKSSYDYAQLGHSIPPKVARIEVHDIMATDLAIQNSPELLSEISRIIKQVSGNFRQEVILRQWNQVLSNKKKNPILTLEITCSKRTYIRGLIRDISEESGVPACILSLTRTHNGPYSIADCVCLL